ncbi:metal-dependent hydrolase [Rufibacter psychrotolerans]|uniref:metal-dependent hydrolase n=1 Tax=Rufibacter psychrotolerans TaxID=2812556 RepID=UPI0019686BB4|nr:metal-dependent hydrolase [Rufibacter sp. SYSU D00308]
MKITYYGQSCFLFDMGGTRVLFDPFITPNPLASEIDIDSIECDYILLSHGHGDHVADAEYLLKKTGATLVAMFEIVSWYQKKGVENVHPMNTGGKVHLPFGTVKMVNAVHSSSLPDGTYAGTAAGFVVESAEKTFYYAGDTALHMDMKLIGDRYRLDFALLPIGDNFTMDMEDALVAANYVNVNKIIGMHYDTFPYIEIDHVEALELARRQQKELILMEIGQTLEL